MTVTDIAFKHLVRRKGRAAFILAGLAVGAAAMVAVVTYADAMAERIQGRLEKYGANILVLPKTRTLALNYGGMSLGGVNFEMNRLKEADLAKVRSIKNAANVAAVGPMLLEPVRVRNTDVLLAGIDMASAGMLKPWWKVHGAFPEADGLLAGAEAAKALNLSTGEAVSILGRPMKVAGVLEPTGSQDDHLLFTPLKTAQALLHRPGEISMAEVAALCSACPIDDMVRQISEAIPSAKVMAISSVVKGRMAAISQFRGFAFGVSVLVVLVGGMTVLVTMMGSVRERVSEIGVFSAVGFDSRRIVSVFLIEAAVISLLSGLAGYGIGWLGAAAALSVSSGQTVLPGPDPALLAAATGIALAVGLGASVYPALRAGRLDPCDALRNL